MKITTAIFDLDGTLLNTIDDLASAGNKVLEEMGFPAHSVDQYAAFVGDGMKTLVRRILPQNHNEDQFQEACTLFRKFYADGWADYTEKYQNIDQMLMQLKQMNIGCCILSNKPHKFTRMCVEHFFLENSFKIVLGQRENVPKKPHPQGALDILEQLEVSGEQCVYVGDTAVDMKTGNDAGLFTIGVTWGFRDREELEANHADLIVNDPMEIVKYVANAR